MNKAITIGQLFTEAEIELATKIIKDHEREMSRAWEISDAPPRIQHMNTVAHEIANRVTRPALDRINVVTGQQNDPLYWAYALEYAITSAPK